MQETDENKANIVFNISGGNNQILPNATHAVQNFYGDDYIEKNEDGAQNAVQSSPDISRLRAYISDLSVLSEYAGRLSVCANAQQLGLVVMDMVADDRVKVDQTEMVKQRFINAIRPLAPQITTSTSNVRQFINKAWEDYIRHRRSGHNK